MTLVLCVEFDNLSYIVDIQHFSRTYSDVVCNTFL